MPTRPERETRGRGQGRAGRKQPEGLRAFRAGLDLGIGDEVLRAVYLLVQLPVHAAVEFRAHGEVGEGHAAADPERDGEGSGEGDAGAQGEAAEPARQGPDTTQGCRCRGLHARHSLMVYPTPRTVWMTRGASPISVLRRKVETNTSSELEPGPKS